MKNMQQVHIDPNGSRVSARGPAQSFAGNVIIDPLFDASDNTAWHTHPAGQTLIVTSGTGWVQEWGGERRQIQPGDVISIPANVKHWHGGTATNRMSHIAITNVLEGKMVEWLEQVSVSQYMEPSRQ